MLFIEKHNAEVKALHMVGGLFLQFLDHGKLNIESCDAPPDTPLFASDLVQNEIEACQIICWLFCERLHIKFAGAKSVFSRLCVNRKDCELQV